MNDVYEHQKEMLNVLDEFNRKYEEAQRESYHLNVIDELHINENAHSRILCKLLQYQNEVGEYELLNSLIAFIKENYKEKDFGRICIKKPEITTEKERIDLWIRDETYAIIIENKIYDAADQHEQLKRYIDKTKNDHNHNCDSENIFVVYLTRDEKEPSVDSWGGYKEQFENRYVNLTFKNDILKWLKDYVQPEIRYNRFNQALSQYIDYLMGLFNQRECDNIINKKMKELIENYFKLSTLNDKECASLLSKKREELSNLDGQIQDLRLQYRDKVFEEWKKQTKEAFKDLEPINEEGYYTSVVITIDGRKFRIEINQEGRDYSWNKLYCQVEFETFKEGDDIMKTPLSKLREEKDELLNEKNNICIWKYFERDDFDGVYECFKQVVEKCIKISKEK